MRYALSTSPQRTTWGWLLEAWQRADAIDLFESGWTFDHLYPLFGDDRDDCMDGWVTLTALLQATSRLRGGVLVTGMAYRHPGVLANMASTLDHVSGGRLELGIGAGWNEIEFDAFGIPLGSMRERFDRFEEGLEVLHRLFTEPHTTFAGQQFRLDGAMNNPKPIQQPLPICIGGRGRKRTLPLAARYAHHWNYTGEAVAEFGELRQLLADSASAIGRDPAEISSSVLLRWADDDDLRRSIDEYGEAGVDLVLVSLPKDRPASSVEQLAEVLSR